MERIKHIEGMVSDLTTKIVDENKSEFAKHGYLLEARLESADTDEIYEAQSFIFLSTGSEEVMEIFPIDIVFIQKGNDPLLWVDENNLSDLEKELRAEITRWIDKYVRNRQAVRE
ncbi:MAG: hypothetical protein ACYC56_08380 [Candidatus Aquicultor sp.]